MCRGTIDVDFDFELDHWLCCALNLFVINRILICTKVLLMFAAASSSLMLVDVVVRQIRSTENADDRDIRSGVRFVNAVDD